MKCLMPLQKNQLQMKAISINREKSLLNKPNKNLQVQEKICCSRERIIWNSSMLRLRILLELKQIKILKTNWLAQHQSGVRIKQKSKSQSQKTRKLSDRRQQSHKQRQTKEQVQLKLHQLQDLQLPQSIGLKLQPSQAYQ